MFWFEVCASFERVVSSNTHLRRVFLPADVNGAIGFPRVTSRELQKLVYPAA